MKQARRFAWLAMLIADAGLLAWGAMACLAPDYLLGPGSQPILAAGYESFTGRTWQELMAMSPTAAAFMGVLFRVYGAYVVAFGLLAIAIAVTAFRRGDAWSWWALLVGNTIAFASAMTYDWTVGAIMGVGSVIGANLGARLATSPVAKKYVFYLLALVISGELLNLAWHYLFHTHG